MLNESLSKKRKGFEMLMKALMLLSVGLTAALVLFLLIYVLGQGIPNITWELLSTKPSYLTERIGILPDILNTVKTSLKWVIIIVFKICTFCYSINDTNLFSSNIFHRTNINNILSDPIRPFLIYHNRILI